MRAERGRKGEERGETVSASSPHLLDHYLSAASMVPFLWCLLSINRPQNDEDTLRSY